MKVMHVVGNRPQFIKLAPVSRELRKRSIQEIIIHTGQHYDGNMSDIFFDELEIPHPYRNLGIGSGSHAQTTAKAILELEKVMNELQPDCIIIYGDTNSTLAAAIVACKLQMPIVHIESGGRTFDLQNPEECNRLIAERVSTYLCASDPSSMENLRREGYAENRIFFTGDVMYDEFIYCAEKETPKSFKEELPPEFVLMTWHRQENTSNKLKMEIILDFIKEINFPVVFPMHPRTRKMLQQYGMLKKAEAIPHLTIMKPIGYLEMVYLLKRCKIVVTDSGGLPKEASFVRKRCAYIVNLQIYPELQDAGYIQMINMEDADSRKGGLAMIRESIQGKVELEPVTVFGSGDAAVKIVDIIEAIK